MVGLGGYTGPEDGPLWKRAKIVNHVLTDVSRAEALDLRDRMSMVYGRLGRTVHVQLARGADALGLLFSAAWLLVLYHQNRFNFLSVVSGTTS